MSERVLPNLEEIHLPSIARGPAVAVADPAPVRRHLGGGPPVERQLIQQVPVVVVCGGGGGVCVVVVVVVWVCVVVVCVHARVCVCVCVCVRQLVKQVH